MDQLCILNNIILKSGTFWSFIIREWRQYTIEQTCACVRACVPSKTHAIFLLWGLQPSSLTKCERPSRISGNFLSPLGSFVSFPMMPVLHCLVLLRSGPCGSGLGAILCVQTLNTNYREGSGWLCAGARRSGFSLFFSFWLFTNLFSTTLANLILILQSKRRSPVPPAYSTQFLGPVVLLAPRRAARFLSSSLPFCSWSWNDGSERVTYLTLAVDGRRFVDIRDWTGLRHRYSNVNF